MNEEKTQSRGNRVGALARALVGRKWWWTTILVLAGMALLFRLGIWQLDRLDQRRAKNALLQTQLAAPAVLLNDLTDPAGAEEALISRQVTVRGEYDFTEQVLLKLQMYNGQPGGHLLTPLLMEGSEEALLVDRGWLPESELLPEGWSQFDEPGLIEATGYIQATAKRPANANDDNQGPQLEWYRVDIPGIANQLPYELLPYYLMQIPPEPGAVSYDLPLRETPVFDLSEGSHMGYALQWFAFTLMLGGGYVLFVNRSLSLPDEKTE